MKNSDQPINALSKEETDRVDAGVKFYTGLTKREYAAIMAMQGLLSIYDPSNNTVPNMDNVHYMACLSVTAADCLLAELEKEQSK